MSASDATFSMQAYKTKCIDLENVRKNTKFDEIESLFNITQKLVMEHPEEILNVKCLEYGISIIS